MHTIHIRSLLYLATITCIAAGCPDDGDSPDGQLLADSVADSVADSSTDTSSPDAEVSAEVAPTCCPIAQTPECGCVSVGGAPGADGQCGPQICDSNPADWVTVTDSDGCPYLETGNGSCLGGGPDAEVTLDADDVGDAEVAETEPDADDGDADDTEVLLDADAEVMVDAEVTQPEVMVDTEVVSSLCCPIADGPVCDCVQIGGSPDSGGTCGPMICDSNPADWVYGTDENGCPTLDVGLGSCIGG